MCIVSLPTSKNSHYVAPLQNATKLQSNGYKFDNASGWFSTASNCIHIPIYVTLSLPESVMETFTKIITFASVVEILWCDHSNETSLAVLFIFKYFTK